MSLSMGLEHSGLLLLSNMGFHILSCFPYVKDIDVGMEDSMMLGGKNGACFLGIFDYSFIYAEIEWSTVTGSFQISHPFLSGPRSGFDLQSAKPFGGLHTILSGCQFRSFLCIHSAVCIL